MLSFYKRNIKKVLFCIPFANKWILNLRSRNTPVLIRQRYDVREIFLNENTEKGFNRYDIIVRLLAIECEKGLNDCGWDFYRRMQSARMGKSWVEPAVERFKNLISSYEQNGYNQESEIELDNSLHLIDGSHRMAMALFYNQPVISARVNPQKVDVFYGIEWFRINGFTENECNLLENRFQTIIGGG